LDLVLVAPAADPPVARIMDYGKFKYELKKKQHQPHRHQSQLKELRLRPKTDEHDLEVRLGQARRFLERGDRVLVNMLFRGREVAHRDLGRELLDQFAAKLADVAKVEKPPTMEHARMGMILVQK
jgi:translation initiation factor IF-3